MLAHRIIAIIAICSLSLCVCVYVCVHLCPCVTYSDPQAKNGVIHCIVLFDGSKYIAGDHRFDSVNHVIEHFKHHTLCKELLMDFIRAPVSENVCQYKQWCLCVGLQFVCMPKVTGLN